MKPNPIVTLIAFILTFTLITPLGCTAPQDTHTPDNPNTLTDQQIAKRLTDRLNESLKLDEHDYQQVYDINLQYVPKMRTIINSDEFRFKKARQLRQLEEDKEHQLQNILTPEQFTQYMQQKQQLIDQVRSDIEKQSQQQTTQQDEH